jgi:hypothetical protein
MSSTQAGPRSLAAFSLRASAWFSRQLPLIDQQRESFEETQFVDRSILLLRLQTLDHALQPHG